MTACADCRRSDLHATAWALVGATTFLRLCPVLFRRGMHWDGVIYATISRNIACGTGDIWHPCVTSTFLPHFHEHPPLAFWLEALFFRVLGDHFWVERIYGLIAALITGGLLIAIWRSLLGEHKPASACSWLAIALWVPWGMWSYCNNMLESTMGVFTALSVYAALRALENSRGRALWSALAGVAITAAVLTKGPVGLFPAVTPAVAWVTLRRVRLAPAVLVQIGVLGFFAASLALMLIPAASREYFDAYWQQQVLSSLRAQRECVNAFPGRLMIVVWLARELIIPVLVAGGLLLLSRTRRGTWPIDPLLLGPRRFCLCTALSASLPLMACPKQAGHYALPSWPFFAFTVALWVLPAVLEHLPRLAGHVSASWHRRLRVCAAGLACCAVWFLADKYGSCSRDRSLIEAAHHVGQTLEPQSTVAVPTASWERLSIDDRLKFHVYLYRYYRVSLWADEQRPSFDIEQFRLERPDRRLTMAPDPIATDIHLDCHPLVVREQPLMAARDSLLR